MYNQDEPKEKKKMADVIQIRPPITMSLKEKLSFYVIHGTMAEAYGFTLTMTKKLILSDQKKFDRYDSETRSVLLEIYEENK